MKAEHRKELHTNVLADRLGKFFRSFKTGPKTTSIALWVVILVGVASFFGWRYWSKESLRSNSERWLRLDSATKEDDLKTFYDNADNKGTLQARIARFEEARFYLAQGQRSLYSDTQREKALTHLKKAQDLYDGLIDESSDFPSLKEEALMGAATTREARGEYEEAQKYYKRLAQEFPNRFLGKAAQKDAEEAKVREEVQKALDNLARKFP